MSDKMKTHIFILLALILIMNGCLSDKHMEFEKIPINGTIDNFANELIKSGFTNPQKLNDNQIKLSGVFLERSCEIYVLGTNQNQTAYKVRVNLPFESKDLLESGFFEIQQLYTSQYGNGLSRYHHYRNADRFLFNEPKRIRELTQGDFTRFTTRTGVITLVVRVGYISITYLDRKNGEIWKRESGEEDQIPVN